MIKQKLGVVLMLLTLGAGSASASGCGWQRRAQKPGKGATTPIKPTPMPTATPTPTGGAKESPMNNGEIKELAAANRSTIFESFVLVARDVATYDLIRKQIAQLPEQSADFFKQHAVVAAFLGQRRTGGYSVEIKRTADGSLAVIEHAPSKRGMVTMALTAPLRVVSVAVEMDEPLALALDAAWQSRLRPYRVESGDAIVTGGFGGSREKSKLGGTLSVMRAGHLATFVFDLQSTGGHRARTLRDTASGTVEADGSVALGRVDAFSLSGATESPFHVKGQFTDKEQHLSLAFETIPAAHVSDNFSATAQLEAATTAPAPENKAVTGDAPM